MKKHKGIILSVFSTLGNYVGIEPWIFRILGVMFFSKIIGMYFMLGIIFSLFLDEDDSFNDREPDNESDDKIKSSKNDYI